MEITELESKRRFFVKYFEMYFNTSSSVKSPRVSLLRESLYLERTKWHRSSNKIRRTQDTLKGKLSEEHVALISRIAHGTYEKCFLHHMKRLQDKYERLAQKQGKTKQGTTRPSLIKNPILQLQKG